MILDYHINNLTEFFCGPGAGLVILELISPLHILKRATRWQDMGKIRAHVAADARVSSGALYL